MEELFRAGAKSRERKSASLRLKDFVVNKVDGFSHMPTTRLVPTRKLLFCKVDGSKMCVSYSDK